MGVRARHQAWEIPFVRRVVVLRRRIAQHFETAFLHRGAHTWVSGAGLGQGAPAATAALETPRALPAAA